jgi:hypothetical protein
MAFGIRDRGRQKYRRVVVQEVTIMVDEIACEEGRVGPTRIAIVGSEL